MYREQLLLPMNLNKPSNHFLQPLFGGSIFFYTLYVGKHKHFVQPTHYAHNIGMDIVALDRFKT